MYIPWPGYVLSFRKSTILWSQIFVDLSEIQKFPGNLIYQQQCKPSSMSWNHHCNVLTSSKQLSFLHSPCKIAVGWKVMNSCSLNNCPVSYTNLTSCSQVAKIGQSCHGMTKLLASNFCMMCTFSVNLTCTAMTSLGLAHWDLTGRAVCVPKFIW